MRPAWRRLLLRLVNGTTTTTTTTNHDDDDDELAGRPESAGGQIESFAQASLLSLRFTLLSRNDWPDATDKMTHRLLLARVSHSRRRRSLPARTWAISSLGSVPFRSALARVVKSQCVASLASLWPRRVRNRNQLTGGREPIGYSLKRLQSGSSNSNSGNESSARMRPLRSLFCLGVLRCKSHSSPSSY